MEFRTDVALGLTKPLSVPLMNGGGCVKTVEDVAEAAQSLTGAVVAGSFTVPPRTGNEGSVLWSGPNGTLNSLGMPNGGKPYLEKHLPEMVKICHDHGKSLIVNVAGFSAEQYLELTRLCADKGVDGVELNLGCPNVVTGENQRKPIASYNKGLVEDILYPIAREMKVLCMPYIPIWVKLSPILDGDHIGVLARVFNDLRWMVRAVTVINTVPNCVALNTSGQSEITVGYAGMSGLPVKYLGLGQVQQWRGALSEHTPVIGVGGISCGQDIRDYDRVGASAVQVTTELIKTGKHNFRVFDRLAMEYTDL